MKTADLRFFISDIETPREFFLFGGRFRDTGEIVKFRINRWQNDLYAMVKWIHDHRDTWFVGFNYWAFDSQVIEYILRNYESWHDKTNLEICELIALKGGDAIDDQQYDIPPRVGVEHLSFRIIDLFRTHHFDNDANRTSLKWLEVMMDMPQVAEMPIHHDRRDLTWEEIQLIEDYWINDLDATAEFLNITLGETDLSLYKGKNMLQERLDVAARFGFKVISALNWSDTKIGEQINMHRFCKKRNIKPEDVYEMKRKRKQSRPFTFGKCIPDHVVFTTKLFQDFYTQMKGVRVTLGKDKREFPLTCNGTTYNIARGGIHSQDPKRIIIVPEGYILVDIDLGSQYPGTLGRRLLYPAHLGIEWCENLLETMGERIQCKAEAKQRDLDSVIKAELEGRAEYLKKSLNAGGYGMTGQKDSWQYDPFIMYSCTIGNQFEMLMLVEELEGNNVHCISANTDGLTVMLKKEDEALFHEICDRWEQTIKLPIINGEMQGRLEYTEYEGLIQEHVNCYIAFKKGGKMKVKGRFAHEVLLNKNNTAVITRVQRMAIQEYFSKGTPVSTTIRGCDDIMKFIFGYKSRKFTFLSVAKDGTETDHGHLLRCYVSTNGQRMKKSKEEDDDSEASEAKLFKDLPCTAYNQHVAMPMDARGVNYEWYEAGADLIIRQIEGSKNSFGRKPKKPPPPPDPNQQSLF